MSKNCQLICSKNLESLLGHTMEGFPERLRELRGNRSREDFADFLGINPRSLINYESGQRVPKADILKLICSRAGVSSDWLLSGEEQPFGVASGPAPTTPQPLKNERKSSRQLPGMEQGALFGDTEARLRREIEILNGEITRLYSEKRDISREYYETCEALDAASVQRDKLLEERNTALERVRMLELEIAKLKKTGEVI